MSASIHVVDYGAGNIGSVLNMLKRVGAQAFPTADPATLRGADKILLPGVGSFDNAMEKLGQLGLDKVLRERALAGARLLGICLGMQLLADGSEEGSLPGLGLIPGRVRRLGGGPGLKIPHMGWNLAHTVKTSALTAGLEADARFYFVHSYHFEPADSADRLLETVHGHAFASGVERGNVHGLQFHPEKSHRFGMKLMGNFAGL